LLATAPSRVTGLDDGYCAAHWHHEFHDQDTGLYRDLARDPVPASGLRLATDDRPMRSPRYRGFIAPQGYHDELRVAYRVGGRTWAMAAYYREKGRPAFSADDVALLSAVSSTVAAGMRARSAGQSSPWPPTADAPGLLLFGGDNLLVSANAEAASWFGQIGTPDPDRNWLEMLADPAAADLRIPFPLFPLLAKARAVAAGHEAGPVRLRLRDRTGRWLVMHASCLLGAPVGVPGVAVVIEPAKSSEVAPIVIEAYGLTGREREVVGSISRGLTTPEIAAELFLSQHTVRDYVKAVFEKTGVSSRGELVAKLFAEHYSDPLHATMVHASADPASRPEPRFSASATAGWMRGVHRHPPAGAHQRR
jgi:DNA-binding CsgD family transcriptional regulator